VLSVRLQASSKAAAEFEERAQLEASPTAAVDFEERVLSVRQSLKSVRSFKRLRTMR
jgi:hypothetical protein